MKTMIIAAAACALSTPRAFADASQKADLALDAATTTLNEATAKVAAATAAEETARSAVSAAEAALNGATDETRAGLESELKTAKDGLASASKELKSAKSAESKAKTAHGKAEKKAKTEREKQDKLDKAAAAKAEKEQAKAAKAAAREAARQPEQNGVRRPKPETLCGRAWQIFDDISRQNGSPASIGEAMPLAKSQGLNEANVRTEYARWRKFHGVSGRIAAPKAETTVVNPPAAPAPTTEAPATEAPAEPVAPAAPSA